MKKYLICSDIHRRVERLKEILKKEKGLDGIIIAGDIEADSDEIRQLAGDTPVYMVAGNCDSWWGEDLPSLITIPACGHRIMVTHGHRYSVPYLNRLAEKAREKKADIVIFGHTHCYFMKKEDGILFLNPGAIRECRDTGRPSYCLMVLGDDGKIHVRKKEFR